MKGSTISSDKQLITSLVVNFLSFYMNIMVIHTTLTSPKYFPVQYLNISSIIFKLKQENIVDSRFKLLASDFQDQINDLKGVVLEVRKTGNNGVFEGQYHHEIKKRQTSKATRPFCENSGSLCTFFYPDHPDAGRKKGNYSSSVTNEMLQGPIKVKGVPSSCKDLQLLGHKLNGFYLVKTSQPHKTTKIETVFCNFTAALNGNTIFHNIA